MDDMAQMHRKSGRFGLIEAGSAFGSGDSSQLHPSVFSLARQQQSGDQQIVGDVLPPWVS